MEYFFRKANDHDEAAVISIFNYFVENGFAAYYEKKVGHDFFLKLKEMASYNAFYVVETNDREVVGFGLLHSYHHSEVFKRAAEVTYFISPEHTRKGLGKRLLDILLEEAKKMGVETLLANISSKNKASIDFHRKNAFHQCGKFRRIGRKFGEDFDVVWMQRFI